MGTIGFGLGRSAPHLPVYLIGAYFVLSAPAWLDVLILLALPVILGAALWLWGGNDMPRSDEPRSDEPQDQDDGEPEQDPGGLLAAA